MNQYYQIECACHQFNDINEHVCNYCGTSLPYTINIRRASLPIEKQALSQRYGLAKQHLQENSLETEGEFLENEIRNNGKGVINTQFLFLWEWLFHNNFSYESYRRQVIKGARLKAKFENDIKRSVADSILFGSENDIVYSALSIDEKGIESYGGIVVVLKTYSIEQRTSSLERNSYHFINNLLMDGWHFDNPIPPGYMSVWRDLCKLVLAKLHKNIGRNLNIDQLADLVLHSSGNRASDDFIELYIYGKIIATAIEKIKIPFILVNSFSAKEKLMFNEISSKFSIVSY